MGSDAFDKSRFIIVGKTPVENEMLNISGSWLEISFFSKFNIFVGMLLGPTDFFESKEDIMFCISDLFVVLRKKQFWVLFFCNSEKCLREGLIFSFAFSAIVAKHKYQHKHNLFLSVTIELHKCDKNGTATLKARWRYLTYGVSKSIVRVMKHANFQLCGVHPDRVI